MNRPSRLETCSFAVKFLVQRRQAPRKGVQSLMYRSRHSLNLYRDLKFYTKITYTSQALTNKGFFFRGVTCFREKMSVYQKYFTSKFVIPKAYTNKFQSNHYNYNHIKYIG